MKFYRTAALILALSMLMTGCFYGAKTLGVSSSQYNEVVQRTQAEQLLLNLVRLRYRDNPLFLEVGSVTTQYSINQSASLSTGSFIGGSGDDFLNLGLSGGFTEKPTFNLQPLQGPDFSRRMLSPIALENIAALVRSGWSIDRVLRLCTNEINGVENAPTATGPTPSVAPEFLQFAMVTSTLRALQQSGTVTWGATSSTNRISPRIPRNQMTVADMIAAHQSGLGVEVSDAGYHLTTSSSGMEMQVSSAAFQLGNSEMLRSFFRLLNLNTENERFSVGAGSVGASQVQSANSIHIASRSLLGILYYLSNAVEVPVEHTEAGLVTMTVDEAGNAFDWSEVTGDLLVIQSGADRPESAAVAIQHRGHWYWVDDADLNSKSTLILLSQIFALQAGGGESVAPVLTVSI